MKSRDRILDAAIPVFARKGRHGAHMEEIAALAHINKAMIYYIFHNKDELYLEVLKFVFNETSFSISGITDEDADNRKGYAKVFSDFISSQISFFAENRNYTKIMVDAMSSGAEEMPLAIEFFKNNHRDNDPTSLLRRIIEKGKAAKFIRNIDTDQLIISMIGMVIIYFFSKSITTALDIEVKDEKKFLEERKDSIIDLVLTSIMIPDPAGSKDKTK
ncbi:MAG TPA: TetR/AcrR family transcriptional regulator, partial [Spirochaetota bacterium]|nr:TetR/AcrR family transcriptional regulator [Spirochaetota bacterium]